ncbi:GFA family protein [Candidatus Persebacteraceae bacterium Df01]|jgi:hypothetical protein|uniref:GFA family protein n=1 Tax=Candidatus Doriopsillibacter californiensis TaxID=2970740 RepID=A0ABT7QP13_9GAMM|nr:GFA family protein [Candidatus Persebacteraceae bacterium Df01]
MSDSNNNIHYGGCLCGAVRYTLNGALRPISNCHCKQCRQWSGHYVSATRPAEGIDINDPQGMLKWYQSSPTAKRGFCGQCGSSLFWDGGGSPSVMAGTMDDTGTLTARQHIFTADKGAYYNIEDDLPKYPQSSPPDTR